MRNILISSIVVVTVGLVVSLCICGVSHLRDAAAQMECKNRLRQIGCGMENYHDSNGTYPHGTLPNDELPPERRLSWLPANWGYFGDGQVSLVIDKTRSWDSEENNRPTTTRGGRPETTLERSIGGFFYCPRNPTRGEPGRSEVTHYVGIAGVGNKAATFQAEYPGAGVFGYDRTITRNAITNNLAATMVVSETMYHNGPWIAGGPSTVRGLDPDGPPYLGPNGQFGSIHQGTHVLFADNSVRSLNGSVNPRVFEAMAAIAGHEVVETIGD